VQGVDLKLYVCSAGFIGRGAERPFSWGFGISAGAARADPVWAGDAGLRRWRKKMKNMIREIIGPTIVWVAKRRKT
jgi:hypothetical protein